MNIVEPEPKEVDAAGAKFVNISKADLDKMNVASLKAELARRGVNAKEKKAKLKERLVDALERLVKDLPEGMVKAHGSILGGFAETAYWSQLKPRYVIIG
jgi:FKBP-type peptidyl-prolyl cis-trans isomerase (trigger factor)